MQDDTGRVEKGRRGGFAQSGMGTVGFTKKQNKTDLNCLGVLEKA